MRWVLYFVPVWFVLALLIPVTWMLISIWRRYRGSLPVTCPESNEAASVQVDFRHAAAMNAMGSPVRKLHACSRWPARVGCGQECLRQIG